MQNLNKANRCSYRQIQTYNIFLLLKKKKIVSRILKKKKNYCKQVFLDYIKTRFFRHKDNEAWHPPLRSLRRILTSLMVNKADLKIRALGEFRERGKPLGGRGACGRAGSAGKKIRRSDI